LAVPDDHDAGSQNLVLRDAIGNEVIEIGKRLDIVCALRPVLDLRECKKGY